MSDRLMVGTDIMKMPEQRKKLVDREAFLLPEDKKVMESLRFRYLKAKHDSAQDLTTSQFGWKISFTSPDKKSENSTQSDSTAPEDANTKKILANSTYESDLNPSAEKNGERLLTLENASTGEKITLSLRGDARITFDTAGNPVVEQGSEIYNAKGALTAKKSGDILIRQSSTDVDCGDMTATLFNMGEQGGTIQANKGSMTFLGIYDGTSIQAGHALNEFKGVFTGCSIVGGNQENIFSGVFSGCLIEGGAGADHFTGFFMEQCTLNGNDGDDTFTGIYNRSALSGGKGYTIFGTGRLTELNPESKKEDLSSQFYSVSIDASEGDSDMKGVFIYANIMHGSYTHNLEGVFCSSSVHAGSGSSNIKAYFADTSTFTAESGNHIFSMRTGTENRVELGSGINSISMGPQSSHDEMTLNGQSIKLEDIDWLKSPHEIITDGTLRNNIVDARRGMTNFFVNTGDERTQTVINEKSPQELADEEADALKENSPIPSQQYQELSDTTRTILSGGNMGPDTAVRVVGPHNEVKEYTQGEAWRKKKPRYINTFSTRV